MKNPVEKEAMLSSIERSMQFKEPTSRSSLEVPFWKAPSVDWQEQRGAVIDRRSLWRRFKAIGAERIRSDLMLGSWLYLGGSPEVRRQARRWLQENGSMPAERDEPRRSLSSWTLRVFAAMGSGVIALTRLRMVAPRARKPFRR
jgi:hypothetical protein